MEREIQVWLTLTCGLPGMGPAIADGVIKMAEMRDEDSIRHTLPEAVAAALCQSSTAPTSVDPVRGRNSPHDSQVLSRFGVYASGFWEGWQLAQVLALSIGGLRSAGLRSRGDAEALATPAGVGSSHPGIAAFDSAVTSARARQSRRMARHADKVVTAANYFDLTDGPSAPGQLRSV